MTVEDFEEHARSLGYTVEILSGRDEHAYTVIRAYRITVGSLAGKTCDVAIQRPNGNPMTVPAAIHTDPALIPMGTRNTQQSPIGGGWQYWSRRFDKPPTPQNLWAHIATIFSEV
jgi:hypothetical protein